jgi:hypothetical protein
MPNRPVVAADYISRRALWLPESSRYDWIMERAAISGTDLPKLITDAMTAIEADALVIAETPVAVTTLGDALATRGLAFEQIGDCVAPRRASLAFYGGRELALRL